MKYCYFYSMEQRGGLREAVATMDYLSEYDFSKLIKDYHYYSFDERIGCVRFIANSYDQKYFYLLVSDLPLIAIKRKCSIFLNRIK